MSLGTHKSEYGVGGARAEAAARGRRGSIDGGGGGRGGEVRLPAYRRRAEGPRLPGEPLCRRLRDRRRLPQPRHW